MIVGGSDTSYGVDVDTYNISSLLLPGQATATTTYSAGSDRVLLTAQTTASQNGVYVVAAGAWARALDADAAKALDLPKVSFNEAAFRFALNQDAMATEKLAEGIRLFAADAGKLDQMIESLR